MEIQLDNIERQIAQCISEASQQLSGDAYFVGGFVRDKLMRRPGKNIKDIDIVFVGNGIALANRVAELLGVQNKVVVFKRFGTAMLKFKDIELEFVGARKESYSADSRKPAVEEGTLEDDQLRRDFTINAMAISLNKNNFGALIDPFNGMEDLENGVIRTPREPVKTFSDDPLRMLRGIRFATQLSYHLEQSSFEAIMANRDRIKIISAERISDELNKIILSPKPSIGFKLLSKTGLLNIIFPEMESLKGVEIINGIGHKDNFYHTLQVLDNLSENTDKLWLRWAAILHDIAKPATKRFNKEHGWTFHGHEVVGARMVPRIFKRFRLPLDHKMKYVQKLVRLHLRPISLTNEDITDSAVRRLLFDAGDDIDDLLLLCNADITSKNERKVARIKANYERVKQLMIDIEEKDRIRNWQPPIDGNTIMKTFNIGPGRVVGDIKLAIREAILDGKIGNNYEEAYAYMLEFAREKGLELSLS
jgi:putative nucleotidyltransferase with HDIG domain